MATQDLVAKIHDYAMAHYSEGWDFIVECYPDEDVLELLDEGTTTFDAAIAELQEYVTLRQDQMEDAGVFDDYF